MTKRLTIILDDDLHRKFKRKSVELDRDMSDLIREMIEKFVAK